MVGQLILVAAGAALLAIAFALVVRHHGGRVTDYYGLHARILADIECPIGEAWWLGESIIMSLQQPRSVAVIKNIT